MPLLRDLPAETILDIYSACSSIYDVLNLSQTCKRLHGLLPTSKKLPVLLAVTENNAGPTFDIVQLLTVNDVQAAHEIRQPPISYSLLRNIISVSYAAQEWQEIYPMSKWDKNYADRRVLNSAEQHSLRRAIYRLWLFSRAFHNCNYVRESRLLANTMTQRCRLLRSWSTEELAEIEDFRSVVRSVLESTLLGTDLPHWELEPLFPGSFHQQRGALSLSSRMCLYPATRPKNVFHTSYDDTAFVRPGPTGLCGWTDEIDRFYVLEDLMKLDPEQVLWFRDIACLDVRVSSHVTPLGEEWFMNNGETFSATFESVLSDRGESPEEIRRLIASGDLGIARRIGVQHVD